MAYASDLIPDSALASSGPPPADMGSASDLIPMSALDENYKVTAKPPSLEATASDWTAEHWYNPLSYAPGEFLVHGATAIGSALGAGAGAIAHLARGGSISEADKLAKETMKEGTYQPRGEFAKKAVAAFEGPYNPLNWPSKALGAVGQAITADMTQPAAPEAIRTAGTYLGPAIEGAGNVGLGLYGATKALGIGKAAPPTLGAKAEGPAPAGFDTEPVEGGVVPEAVGARAQVLQRVGLDKARHSALIGDAQQAAGDYQLTKFEEPAGVAAKAQFDAEKEALAQHASNVVEKTGGSLGMDEDSLNARGQAIAAPFDALRKWFSDQKKADYAAADAKAEGKPIGAMEGTGALLKDPDFTETLLAKDQGGLLGSVQRQFQRFQELNPGGWTVATAENFRKWLNQVWTPENSATLGKLKGAVDDDVLKGAGDDIYGPARARVQLEHQVLDDPTGISKLFDRDPRTPLNRATAYRDIPDKLWRLDPDQFGHVIQTLKDMPKDVYPLAQQALAEIQAHFGNKLLDAGSSTQGQWNAAGVSKILKANSGKIETAFTGVPEVLSNIKDLDSAGRILKVNQSYPGAAAQTANALKRGFMSHALSRGGGVAGATAGSLLGPPGAAIGAAAGEYAGSRLGTGLAEKAALGRWESKLVPLSTLVAPKQ